MEKDIYRKVQEQLDQYSLGFPATESGVEIKILKKLFSTEDAKLFNNLTTKPETPEGIAERLGLDPSAISDKLLDMTSRGLLYSIKIGEQRKYCAIAFVHGLFEFQVKRLDNELADLMQTYSEEKLDENFIDHISGFFRQIPVQKSLDVKHYVASYEDASEILKNAGNIVVTDCICRKATDIRNEGCERPKEACFMFGHMGQYYLDHGMGRKVDVDEALKILTEGQEAGLVPQPASSQNPGGMCNCCGDCCGFLLALKKHPKPAEQVLSNYILTLDKELCTGCETCEERCQMDAIQMGADDIADINMDRCIGCGLCVTTCPSDALSLIPKPGSQIQIPPSSSMDQAMAMAKKRGII